MNWWELAQIAYVGCTLNPTHFRMCSWSKKVLSLVILRNIWRYMLTIPVCRTDVAIIGTSTNCEGFRIYKLIHFLTPILETYLAIFRSHSVIIEPR